MFDIGFWELTMIAVIALMVIGPDKLPGVARTAGKWVGRARRFVGDVKTDIDRELKQEELRKALAEDAGLDEIKEIMNTDDFKMEADEVANYQVNAIADEADKFEKELDDEEDDYDSQLSSEDTDAFVEEQKQAEKIQAEHIAELSDHEYSAEVAKIDKQEPSAKS